ncbi:hypothetical protein V8E55_006257 [Tylopilus felleus]
MNSSSSTTSFAASVALVLEETKHVKDLHRSPHTKRLEFAVHICLVAHHVRTGHLVDALFPPNSTAALGSLLMALRKKSAVFKDVVCWHHVPTSQSFVVHVPHLQAKITALLDGVEACVFIRLAERPSVSRDPPGALQDALGGMRFAMTESPDTLVLSLSELFTEEVLIPLAAVVIDYPVAYFPAFPAQTSFLEGEPLDVYTVSFEWTSESTSSLVGEHVLLKFSCPQILASSHAELSPRTVIRNLHVKFAAVLERIGASISVTHRTETLERVAL